MELTDNLELAIQYCKTNDLAKGILMNALGTNELPDNEQLLRKKLLDKQESGKALLKAQLRRAQRDTRRVTIKYKWSEYGHCDYYTNYSGEDEIDVPLSVIRDGF